MRDDASFTQDFAIFLTGLSLFLFTHSELVTLSDVVDRAIEGIGIALMGYAPIQLLLHLREKWRKLKASRALDRVMQSAVRPVRAINSLPIFITTDLEGCVTPPNRTAINLRKLQRLRGYCEFVKENRIYPQLIVFTGRSQGYVEFLAQTLNMFESPIDLPFVIENGAALYHVNSKKTTCLLSEEQRELVQSVRALLMDHFNDREFEPKAYMVTLNPVEPEAVDELRDRVTSVLGEKNMRSLVTISSTASAVDITPVGITKKEGLDNVLKYYPHEGEQLNYERIVALGDSISDLPILRIAGSSYCPAENVHPEVRKAIEKDFGSDHVINHSDIDFVAEVIHKECGVILL